MKKRLLLIATIVLAILLLTGSVSNWMVTLPPLSATIDFTTPIARGTVTGEGRYVVYSLGEEVKEEVFLPDLADGEKAYFVEFPLTTKDGETLYGMYYVYGGIISAQFLANTFEERSMERWILTVYIPGLIRETMEKQARLVTLDQFQDQNNLIPEYVRGRVRAAIDPVFNEIGFRPIVMTILIYAHYLGA